MAAATLSTKFSRRSILAAVALPVVPAPGSAANDNAAATPGDADMKLALLAGQYRRTLAALCDWAGEAEKRGGVFAYDEEPYRARYMALIARTDWLVAEIARTRPDSILGLAIKLHIAVWRVNMDNTLFDCDERLMLPALDDADRMAAVALFGAG